jgi:hypothetical protein
MNPCCEIKENRELVSESYANQTQSGIEYTVVSTKEKCKVCGRNHYALDAEPLEIDLSGHG